MPTIISLLFALFISLTSVQGQNGYITGKVYSQASKTPLSNAKLVLRKNGKYHGKLQTDHVGNYWFGDLKAGNYTIWVVQEGYCQLEMDKIEIGVNSSIQLDLGMTGAAEDSNIVGADKIYLVYNQPIEANLVHTSHYQENFKNDIEIISDVYQGHEIKIAPSPPQKPSPMEENRATNYNEGLKGFEKNTAFSSLGRVR